MCAALMAMHRHHASSTSRSRDIRASFGTPLDQIGWVSTGYMMANIVVIPMTGWLQRRFGFRRYFAGSIAALHRRPARSAAWPGTCPRSSCSASCRASAAARSSPPRRAILFARYPQEEHGMAGGALRPRRRHRPAPRPDHRRLPDRRRQLALDLPRQRAGRASSPRCSRYRFIEEPGFDAADASRSTAIGIALLAVGMAVAAVRARGGQPRGLVRQHARSWSSRRSRRSRSSRSSCTSSRRRTRSSTCGCSRTAATPPAPGSTSCSGSRSSRGSYLFSLFCGAVMHYQALDIGRMFLVAGRCPDRC